MKQHSIEVVKTAHYYTLGEPTMDTKTFWICCHGYGQLAKRFVHKFDQLDLKDNFVVAPEGLNRFYWSRNPSTVGSTWMTSEDRLDEIKDYSNYLTTIYEYYYSQLPENVCINLFGFSQGVATVYRWMMEKFLPFDNLIMWGGHLPEDLDYSPYYDYFADRRLLFYYGDEDEFLTPERLEWHDKIITEKGLNIEKVPYQGKHKIYRAVLHDLAAKLNL